MAARRDLEHIRAIVDAAIAWRAAGWNTQAGDEAKALSVAVDELVAHRASITSRRADYMRTYRATATLADDDPRHGTINGYTNHGCRCDRCRRARKVANHRTKRHTHETVAA